MEAQWRELLRRWPKLHTVIQRCGVEGSYIFTERETSFLPTPREEVIVTLGAGDAFAACYVTQYLDGLTRK
ncbi:MAG: PfkB family carbohydrate kinase [Bacteroidales bacterium]|nr:PfkB family carbohydrate kinase [Bacteroidales bacterium]MDY4558782.1 PfkB family carbohydrate kinase [Alloprevotella sp.]